MASAPCTSGRICHDLGILHNGGGIPKWQAYKDRTSEDKRDDEGDGSWVEGDFKGDGRWIEGNPEMDERHTAILVRIDDTLTKMDERHTAILAKMDGTLAKI
jgi:hypothetical protein